MIALFVFKAKNRLAPIDVHFNIVKIPGRTTRSANHLLQQAPKTKYKRQGDQAFGVDAPQLWSHLLIHSRAAQTFRFSKGFKNIIIFLWLLT